jgi:hypothetical protein
VEDAVEDNIAHGKKDDLWLCTFASWPSFILITLPCLSKEIYISLFDLLACFFPFLASLSSISQFVGPLQGRSSMQTLMSLIHAGIWWFENQSGCKELDSYEGDWI